MGKGSERRPASVPDEVLADRWARTFGGAVSNRDSDTDRAPVTGNVATGTGEQLALWPDGTGHAEGGA